MKRSQHFKDWYHLYVLVLSISILISLLFGIGVGYQSVQFTKANETRNTISTNSISKIIERHLWLYDFNAIESISLLLLQNDFIYTLEVTDNNGLVLFKDSNTKNEKAENIANYHYILNSQDSTDVAIGHVKAKIIITSKDQMLTNALIKGLSFFICFFIPFIITVYTYTNYFIAKPLDKLSHAIDQTISSGEPVKANILDSTRFGRFARQFNTMQTKLEQVQLGLAGSMTELQLQTQIAEDQSRLLDNVMRGVGQSVTYFDQYNNLINNDIGDENCSIFKTFPIAHYSSINDLEALLENTEHSIQIISNNPKKSETNILYEVEIVFADRLSINVKGLALDGGGLAIVSTDISKAKELELHLRQAQKLEAIGHLTSGVAHDLNNFLAIITNIFSILSLSSIDSNIDTDLKNIIHTGQETTYKASSVVSSLLTFCRAKPLQTKTISPDEVINNLKSIVLTSSIGHNIKFTHNVLTAKNINIDEDTLNTSLLNLILNARDAINESNDRKEGEISLVIEDTPDEICHQMMLKLREDGYISFSVKDTGKGIHQNNKEKILDPFFTTKKVGEGTGLGLSMVYGFADEVGGILFFKNNRHKGATFTLILPVRSKYIK